MRRRATKRARTAGVADQVKQVQAKATGEPLMAQIAFSEWLDMKEQNRRQAFELGTLRARLKEMLEVFADPVQTELEASGTAEDAALLGVIARARQAVKVDG